MTTKFTLLIVDDMPLNIQILAGLLSDDYLIKVANNGFTALEIAKKTPPDLILLDVVMPELDGYEVCKKLKEDPVCREIPVIFITGTNDKESESKGLQLGALDFISKPFNPDITKLRIRNQLALKQLQEKMSNFFSLGLDLFCIVDADGRFQRVNTAWHNVLGYKPSEIEGATIWDFVHPDDKEKTHEAVKNLFQGKEISGFVNRYKNKAGGYCWLEWQASPSHAEIYASARDITDKLAAENSMRLSKRVFENTREGIVITDHKANIIEVNEGFARITGYSRDEVVGQNPRILQSGIQKADYFNMMWESLITEGFWKGEIWNRKKNGEIYAELLTISSVHNDKNQLINFVGIFSDITSLKKYEERLQKIAYYDALTGIPNRVLLSDRMQQALLQIKREPTLMAVCYLDLDGFKPINDTLGHSAGDVVLIEIAKRISHIIRESDTVARLGGDEFIILLPRLHDVIECEKTLQRILNSIAETIRIQDQTCQVTASIGVAVDQSGNIEADVLLRQADQAMYNAKQSGKNKIHFFNVTHH
ncbi:diguanylate cyclase [Methylicorpusculum oleiharenae]|uniref:diguanylate cyclase domain-containing protein n=1 Tax=Methylicorpusculum oleiharenae TaxID=1338687 RepID=UPI00135AA862|nr:diguanylate cyclase [Methylicorpusculum oleiharenae]MCD2450830.1 diguanylate cyclase [Methylicorpusculum oleiharenae]